MSAADGVVTAAVLGAVEARRDGVKLALGPPRQRAMFAVLLARPGEPVTFAELVEALWAGAPPRSARAILYQYANGLRDVLEPARRPRSPGRWIQRSAGCYQLSADESAVDLLRFRRFADSGRARRQAGDVDGALDDLCAALEVWRGPAAEDLDPIVRAHPMFRALDGERVDVLLETSDLAGSVAQRSRLQSLLHQHPELTQVYGITVAAGHRDVIRPAQLPAGVSSFTGRAEEIAQLSRLAADSRNRTAVIAISGMGGVGKTVLALHWAHSVAADFTDGQLYADLRGFDPAPDPVTPDEVLRRFLEALGVPAQDVPDGLDARSGLFRSFVAGRRMLILLDNARDSDQVRPMLPGAPGSVVVVTSRTPMAGLLIDGSASLLPVDLLDARQSAVFLQSRLGPDTLAGEPGAVRDIVAACGGLPLALAIVAARASTHPSFHLSQVATELRDVREGLPPLAAAADSDIRAAFSWSYRILSPEAARLFRALSVHPGPDAAVTTAASVILVDAERARSLLAEIAGANLLQETRPGRFAYHDLLRAFAREMFRQADDGDTRRAVMHRLTDHYVRSAAGIAAMLRPELTPMTYSPPLSGVTPEIMADHDAALAWYDQERATFLPITRAAYRDGFDVLVCELGWALFSAQDLRGHWHDWITIQRTSLDAAQRRGDPWWIGITYQNIGRGYFHLDEFESCLHHLDLAIPLLRASGDARRLANTHVGYGDAADRLARADEAITHVGRAVELYRQAGDLSGQAYAEMTLGSIAARRAGGLAEGTARTRHARDLHRRTQNRYGEALATSHLAELCAKSGDHAGAIAEYRAADRHFAELRQHFLQASALAEMGVSLWHLGCVEAARAAWDRAAELLADERTPAVDRLRERLRTLVAADR